MKEEKNIQIKTRNWIKGHYYMGLFYGLMFGVLIGLSLMVEPIAALIISILFMFVKDEIEELEFRKNA